MPLIKCPDCGIDISDSAKACPKCGYPLAEKLAAAEKENTKTAAMSAAEGKSRKEKPLRKKKKLFVIIAILIAITIGAVLIVPGLTHKCAVGDIITFGKYPQTADGSVLPVEWQVLDIKDGRALVISKYGLDARPYHTEFVNVTWEICTLREWLNSEFLNTAFSEKEQRAILLTDVDNSKEQGYSGYKTNGGNMTQDKIFLLSCDEASRYFGVQYFLAEDTKYNQESRVAPTEYAVNRGAYKSFNNRTTEGIRATGWWLRSPGFNQVTPAFVDSDGFLSYDIAVCVHDVVRPAFWLNLESALH